jgi:hypothetical protein
MDDADFTRVDQLLFDRLYRGALTPLVVHLKDGGTITGEVVRLSRLGAIGGRGTLLGGELCLAEGRDRITISYDQISDIS